MARISEATDAIASDPYNLVLHIYLGLHYFCAGYPDLAVGAAYKALLLCDAVEDEAEEYHEQATASLEQIFPLQSPAERQQIVDWLGANVPSISGTGALSLAAYHKVTM